MSLSNLFKSADTVGSGQITETLLNGQYRVLFNGRRTIAVSQSGQLSVGTVVTLARTSAGLVIISAGDQTAAAITEVTISG